MRNQLWGKARDYFESSLKLSREAHTCAELARLLSHLGDVQRSNALFAESFQLAIFACITAASTTKK